MKASYPPPQSGFPNEVRCPDCEKLLIAALKGWARIYCRFCKKHYEVTR